MFSAGAAGVCCPMDRRLQRVPVLLHWQHRALHWQVRHASSTALAADVRPWQYKGIFQCQFQGLLPDGPWLHLLVLWPGPGGRGL